uniref:DUF834 domain-containing protein n=1 Tax=Oryza rufipogon TaxID=4529 RepID=A0A0E0R5H3_ORYRU
MAAATEGGAPTVGDGSEARSRGGGLVSNGARRWRKWRRSATTTVVTEAEMLPGARGMSDPRPPTTWGPDPDAGGRRRRSAGTEGGEGGSGGARRRR